jgi:AcrR family transcriptional regulator
VPAPAHTSTAAVIAAGRALLERDGPDALTMRRVADAVGVRAPSLYKHVAGRDDLIRLILEDVADELTAILQEAVSMGAPRADVRRMTDAYRRFAGQNPAAYGLLFARGAPEGAVSRSQRSSAALLSAMTAIVGPADALPAARTVVAWAHGFIMMEQAGAFRLGGDIDTAWDFGIERILDALDTR